MTRPPQPDARATVELPHKFTDSEIAALSKEQNAHLRTAGKIHAELEDITKAYKQRMQAEMDSVAKIRAKLEQGGELRPVDVVVEFHPATNTKFYFSDETKTVKLGEAPMTKKDYELPLL